MRLTAFPPLISRHKQKRKSASTPLPPLPNRPNSISHSKLTTYSLGQTVSGYEEGCKRLTT